MSKPSSSSDTVILSLKIIVYLATPYIYYLTSPVLGGAIITALLLILLGLTFITEKVIWLPARILPWALLLLHAIRIFYVHYMQPALLPPTVIVAHIMLFVALSSEVIRNRRNAMVLVIVGVISVTLWGSVRFMVGWQSLISQFVIFIAASARLFFPPAKHLIHTSLDYRFGRLEILSLGMKRVAAIGLRRNKVHSLP